MEPIEPRITASYEWACYYANRCAAHFSHQFDREDLKSAGILGYVVAASRYDDHKGSSFRSFCASRIRGAIVDEVRRSTWEPRSARYTHQLLARTKLALDADLQRCATDAELARALGIGEIELARIRRLTQPARYVSLDDDTATGDEGELLPLRETLEDQHAVMPSAAADTAEMRRALFAGISKLPPSEASIIVLFYLRGTPFRTIARMMHLTPARISQKHRRGLESLKTYLARQP